jgi:rod shape determining protein RodA
MEKDNHPYQKIDIALLFIILLLGCVSVFAIYSAQPSLPQNLKGINFVGKQITWYILGFIAIAVMMIIDFDRFRQLSWYLYGFGIVLLIGIEIFGPSTFVPLINNTTSWYNVPGIGNFQPSELMKLFLIIILSHVIMKHNETHPTKTVQEDLLLIGKIAGISLPPVFLVLKQPDLGTVLVFFAIIGVLLLVSGIKWRLILLIGFSTVAFIGSLVLIYFKFPVFFKKYILMDYQLRRFYAWLAPHENPDWGYQLIKSMLAIGSGQLKGKGFMDSQVYFPEAHTDFIFAVIGEQFGFIGASFVISLFFLLVYRMIHTALESHDPYGSYLCTGVIGMITFQVFQNIGMTVQLMPITGIPLPFVSYGGSSLVTYMAAIGIVLNVRSRTKKFMFGNHN